MHTGGIPDQTFLSHCMQILRLTCVAHILHIYCGKYLVIQNSSQNSTEMGKLCLKGWCVKFWESFQKKFGVCTKSSVCLQRVAAVFVLIFCATLDSHCI